MDAFENLKRVALNELRLLNEAYAGKDQFSEADAKRYDLITHALKCHLTACAMLEAGDNDQTPSGHSMDEAPHNRSYAKGFQDGVNAMGGHTVYPQYPYTPRRW